MRDESRGSPAPRQVTREHAIALLRAALLKLVDDDHSICRVAAERGLFCRGFRRYSNSELRERYWWLTRRKPAMGREELEDLANRWQLARQLVAGVPLACDTQRIEHDTCGGWDDFSNEELECFCQEIAGTEIRIQP